MLTVLFHTVTIAHFTISIVTPAGSLIRALLLTFNEFSLLCHGNERASYAGDITVYGGPILYLCIQSLLLLGFLIYYDSGYRPAFLSRKVRVRIFLQWSDLFSGGLQLMDHTLQRKSRCLVSFFVS
jgi:cytochrome b561